MARTTRTPREMEEQILQKAAEYTMARTWYTGERREVKKRALRTVAMVMRQLCTRRGHRYGWAIDGGSGAAPGDFKCPVCDPSGDHKAAADTGESPKKKAEKRAAAEMQKPMRPICENCGAEDLVHPNAKCAAYVARPELSDDEIEEMI